MRMRRGKTLQEIAVATRIPRGTIEALEEDRSDALPATVYTKGFIRCICKDLGYDSEDLIRLLESQLHAAEQAQAEAETYLMVGGYDHGSPSSSLFDGMSRLQVFGVGFAVFVAFWVFFVVSPEDPVVDGQASQPEAVIRLDASSGESISGDASNPLR